MSDSHSMDLDKHVRTYILVFVSLMVLTLVTVAVSYLHLPVRQAIAVALVERTIPRLALGMDAPPAGRRAHSV